MHRSSDYLIDNFHLSENDTNHIYLHSQHHDVRLILSLVNTSDSKEDMERYMTHPILMYCASLVTEPSFGWGKGISLSGEWLEFNRVPELSESVAG